MVRRLACVRGSKSRHLRRRWSGARVSHSRRPGRVRGKNVVGVFGAGGQVPEEIFCGQTVLQAHVGDELADGAAPNSAGGDGVGEKYLRPRTEADACTVGNPVAPLDDHVAVGRELHGDRVPGDELGALRPRRGGSVKAILPTDESVAQLGWDLRTVHEGVDVLQRTGEVALAAEGRGWVPFVARTPGGLFAAGGEVRETDELAGGRVGFTGPENEAGAHGGEPATEGDLQALAFHADDTLRTVDSPGRLGAVSTFVQGGVVGA